MLTKPTELSDFLHFADTFYLSLGLLVYDKEQMPKSQWRQMLLRYFFIISMLNLNLVLVTELIYVFLAMKNGSNFLEATMNLSFIGFVVVGDLKIWLIWRAHTKMTKVVHELYVLQPRGIEMQKSYKVSTFLQRYRRISIFYFGTHMFLIWSYNLYWAMYYLINDFWLKRVVFVRMLPYYCWVPWQWQENWSYYLMYVSQNWAGQTCLSGQLASDMFMCALVTLLIMHYQYLARHILSHKAGLKTEQDDMDFLKHVISYHQKILRLCASVNEIFGVSLFCNFASSSFIICFVGFQLTIGGKLDNLIMLLFFLFCALVQVFIISSYAQQLLDSSTHIGNAVYNHDWQHASVRYRRMLVLIIKRAQKPTRLQATSFLGVSLVTLADLLQLSYKFFALLRTMYVKE